MNHQYIVVDGAVAFYVALNGTNRAVSDVHVQRASDFLAGGKYFRTKTPNTDRSTFIPS